MVMSDRKYRSANIFQQLPGRVFPKAFLQRRKLPGYQRLLRRRNEYSARSDALEITCLRFWEPALAAKPNASCGNVRLSLKVKGRANEKREKG